MRSMPVVCDLVLGLALLLLPWTPVLESNWFLWRIPALRSLLLTGQARGAMSGLGAAFLLSAAMDLIEASRAGRSPSAESAMGPVPGSGAALDR